MTAIVVALAILGILQLASFAELCVLAHRVAEMKKQPKYNVHVNTQASHAAGAMDDAMRLAMLRRPS